MLICSFLPFILMSISAFLVFVLYVNKGKMRFVCFTWYLILLNCISISYVFFLLDIYFIDRKCETYKNKLFVSVKLYSACICIMLLQVSKLKLPLKYTLT